MIIKRWQAPHVPDKQQLKGMLIAEGLDPYEELVEKVQTVNYHRHPFDEVRMVVAGELILDIAGNKLLLRSGDKIIIPSNTKHSMSTQSDTPCLCICAKRLY